MAGRSALLESVQSLITTREKRTEAFDGIRSAFQQERYEDALRMLYRLPPELQKGDVEKLKADAWFNDAVGYLEGGNCTEAIRCLGEVLQVDPADAEARRLRNFAQGYMSRGKDTDYLRFVNQLQKRPYRGTDPVRGQRDPRAGVPPSAVSAGSGGTP